jgi:FkbM family methyltransferase
MIYPIIRHHTKGIVKLSLKNASFYMIHNNNSEYWNVKMAPQHEPEFLREFIQVITQTTSPMVIYDIGANMGFYSLVAASLSKSLDREVSIFAFEPEPTIFDTLYDNIALNDFDNITPLLLAVGYTSVENQNRLAVLTGKGGSTFIYNDSESRQGDKTRVAPLVSLDVMFDQGEIPPPDLIKMDIEGYEFEALKGMKNLLSISNVQVFVEIHAEYLKNFGASFSMLDAFMDSLHYQRIQLYEKGLGESYGHKQEHVIYKSRETLDAPTLSVTDLIRT